LHSIIELTNKSFTDPTFSLSALAKELNYSSKYISFFFKKNKGICFGEYLRTLRVKHSVFLMEQGITSVKNIALLSGFSDALYYSKIFKQEIGRSPKEYIESLAGD
jgi:YesN/AraC family two-component response regulator